MEHKPEINVKGETFRLDLSLLAFRRLGEKWGLNSMNAVLQKFSVLDDSQSDVSFEVFDIMVDVLTVFANTDESNPRKLADDEIYRLGIQDVMAMATGITQNIAAAVQTQSTDVGKPEAVKKAAKK